MRPVFQIWSLDQQNILIFLKSELGERRHILSVLRKAVRAVNHVAFMSFIYGVRFITLFPMLILLKLYEKIKLEKWWLEQEKYVQWECLLCFEFVILSSKISLAIKSEWVLNSLMRQSVVLLICIYKEQMENRKWLG